MTTNHDDLREALDMWDRFGPKRGENPGIPLSDLNTIVVAARCWLDLTSDDNVELVAETIFRSEYTGTQFAELWESWSDKEPYRSSARAVLEAVRSNQP